MYTVIHAGDSDAGHSTFAFTVVQGALQTHNKLEADVMLEHDNCGNPEPSADIASEHNEAATLTNCNRDSLAEATQEITVFEGALAPSDRHEKRRTTSPDNEDLINFGAALLKSRQEVLAANDALLFVSDLLS